MHHVRCSSSAPCSASLPICGRIGVSRSILCSGLLPSGGAAQTNMVPAYPYADPDQRVLLCSPGALRCLPRLRLIMTVGSALYAGWLCALDFSVAPGQLFRTFPVRLFWLWRDFSSCGSGLTVRAAVVFSASLLLQNDTSASCAAGGAASNADLRFTRSNRWTISAKVPPITSEPCQYPSPSRMPERSASMILRSLKAA